MSSLSTDTPSFADGSRRLQAVRVARQTIWVIAATALIALIWAALAQIDDITRGEGRVVPLRRQQTIQSLEGGIISELQVGEGDTVQPGQILVKMDPTQFRSAYLQAKSEMEVLAAEVQRLEAEVLEKEDVGFSEPMTEIQATEERLFRARRTKLLESIDSVHNQIEPIQTQIDLTAPLAKGGAVSQVDLLKLQQQKTTLEGKITEVRNVYVQDAYSELADTKAKLLSLQQSIVQKKDQLARTDLRSPVAGRVNNVNITTLGGVVQPGEAIMEVTPIDDQLLIEAHVAPRDVAFIAPGMPASVKITAYDFSVYGDLKGTVEQISDDTVDADGADGTQSFYKVMVKTDRAYLERHGESYPIRPGMIAEVDIQTGRRSVLSYLIRPLIRAQLR
ncbi:HlyD family efflux transporter periplasmic adaptor subunit [Sinirhodobacter huangdaonensis]|uniref:HlyD family efflux transporter periplasmic adaptor subunit n=1 Tax=Paenirhodobacter huangdaonensis TaxID=2501515 RepID=A0A443LW19_9RHOB|nr:HlyD family efflux transporter periplasmic adaptor subunit [Sinirhodobacter huangdaonensis]RWR53359.1 HlyD family efflux transporter periplasmic adaptor subunit [Sinirhodobacter huangdaonensis]